MQPRTPTPGPSRAARFALILLVACARLARADEAALAVHFDLDRSPETGCTVVTAEGTVSGIELTLVSIVDLDTREVVSVEHSNCIDPGAGIFGHGVPTAGAPPTPWGVRDGDGTSGSTLIETRVPVSALSGATLAHAYFDLSSPSGGDSLPGPSGDPGAAGIPVLIGSAAVPGLPEAARAALIGALLLALTEILRRRLRARTVGSLLLALALLNPALVGAALGEGALRSWTGAELVALDPQGDAPQDADLLAAFAFLDPVEQQLVLRADVFFGPAICLDWPTVDPGSGYSCNQEPPPDAGPFGYRVALTFDDGPSLVTTPSIVATLRAESVPATFFMLGNRLQTPEARALALEIHQDPLFEVANHSFSHARFTTLSLEQMRAEVESTSIALRSALGDACYHPRFFRIPYSASNCTSAGVVREHGLSMVGFHVNTLDWCYGIDDGYCSPAYVSNLPAQYRYDMVGWTLTQLAQYGGGVAILHDPQIHTMEQLPALIAALRAAGVTFVHLDDVTAFPLINAAVNPPEAPACCEF